jgi:hypothetical protein
MSWIAANSQSDRIRPSEINGCPVQEVSYLDEIDDKCVLEALERLRGRSLAVPVGGIVTTKAKERPPRAPKQQQTPQSVATATTPTQGISSNSSADSSVSLLTMGITSVSSVDRANVVKGSHRSVDFQKRQNDLPAVMTLTPDSSVASSISSRKNNITDRGNVVDAPEKMTWAWFGKSLSRLHCGGLHFENEEQEGDTTTIKRMFPLGVLKRHLVKRCGNGDDMDCIFNDEEDEGDQNTNSDTVTTNDEENINKESEGNLIGLKAQVARIFDATTRILIEGSFGDNESVSLYTNKEMDTIYGKVENGRLDGTILSLESATYDDDETASSTEAPDDEIHHDIRKGRRKFHRSFDTLGTITIASDASSGAYFSSDVGVLMAEPTGDGEEGQEIDQDGLPYQFLVVGFDPPEDCSFHFDRSGSSDLLMQASNKIGKVIN